MALYAIGDLHLSLGSDKPMDVFGEKWKDHAQKLKNGFACVGENDVTVLCGDLSWAMSLREAEEDFRFMQELPGKKLILKGNHDYWWSTAAKAYKFVGERALTACRSSTTTAMSTETMPSAAHGAGFTRRRPAERTTRRSCAGRSCGWRPP